MSNGVGLSICKMICEQLEGYINVQSTPNYGSEFKFTMRVYRSVQEIQRNREKKRLPRIREQTIEDEDNESHDSDYSVTTDQSGVQKALLLSD